MTDIQTIIAERAKTHGLFSDQACLAQSLKEIMRESPTWDKMDSAQREALEMVQHKVARVLAGSPYHVDHWDDIAGYATLVANELRKGE
jgi:hypothetical protein